MSIALLVICSILLAIQFPIVMSSPIAALLFAAVTTCALGTAATVVGGVIAPLPLFALILVSITCTFYIFSLNLCLKFIQQYIPFFVSIHFLYVILLICMYLKRICCVRRSYWNHILHICIGDYL